MGMVKRLLEDYVAAKHPGDDEAQDELFEAICDGIVQPSLEEMQAVIAVHEESGLCEKSLGIQPPKATSE